MSPVFRHGRLRLYLLKLLDEAPKHGYEMIRLLQDRFMGVYAPSPGTIYPRLARLEEEGLVTHDEVEGRKVYKITEKGRAEIQARMDDLAELEEEITESVRDIAREVKEDVRDTVRSLREEIARAARDVHREDRQQAYEQAHRAREEAYGRPGDAAWQAREEARQRTDWAREEARRLREEARDRREQERSQARRERDQAQRQRDHERVWPGPDEAAESGPREHDPRAGAHPPHEERAGEAAGARFRAGRGRARKDWGDWADWPGWKDWPGWRDWPGWKDWSGWRDRPGGRDWPGSGRTPGWPDPARIRDLERMALQFAADLRRLAAHASTIGEDAFGDLRTILDEALARIRTEVFQPDQSRAEEGTAAAPDPGEPPRAGPGEPQQADAGEPRDETAEPPRAEAGGSPRGGGQPPQDESGGSPRGGGQPPRDESGGSPRDGGHKSPPRAGRGKSPWAEATKPPQSGAGEDSG